MLSKSDLKAMVDSIVRSQGNKFIKELLREHQLPIGKKKDDFLSNLHNGIDNGDIDQAKIEAWLSKIEGWGNQHIYLFKPPELDHADIEKAIKTSKFSDLLNLSYSYDFPEKLELKLINLTKEEAVFIWKQGKESWARTDAKDFQKEIGNDTYEFRAYREKSERKLARLTWKFDHAFCVVLVSQANERGVHDSIFETIWSDLATIGFTDKPLTKVSLVKAFNRLNRRPELKVNSVKMNVDGGHVNLVATAPDSGIHDIEAVRQVQIGIDNRLFSSSDGVFHFNDKNLKGLSRKIKVEGSGRDSRIRVWVQCTRQDVELIAAELMAVI